MTSSGIESATFWLVAWCHANVIICFRDWVAINLLVITDLLLCSGSLTSGLHTE
jgi:hypothetical protein